VALKYLSPNLVAIVIALITLVFAGLWFKAGGEIKRQPRSIAKGIFAGAASGVGSMMAHAGGPAVAMYLLPLGLTKSFYAGTTYMYFVIGNALKVGPWLSLVPASRELWVLIGLCCLACPIGVWTGWHLHERLNDRQLYRICYVLLVVVALKLLWDGIRGYVFPS
jgi:uncharacterized protein